MTPPTPAARAPVALVTDELTWDEAYRLFVTGVMQQMDAMGIPRVLETGAYDAPIYRLALTAEKLKQSEAAAVAQRQRAEDAERDYAVLLKDYNAAAACLGSLYPEMGGDMEATVGYVMNQLTDANQRADALQAERDAAYIRADTEYAARVRLTEKYDELDAELADQRERGDKYALGWINETKRADALAALAAAPEGEQP